MKKKLMPKPRRNAPIKERILWVIIFLLVVVQIVSVLYIAKLYGSLMSDSQESISRLVNSVEERRYVHPVISVSEGRVYIPEARIYLPLNDTSRHLRYEYVSFAHDTKKLFFSVRGAIGRQIADDNPSCDKVVELSRTKQSNTEYVFAATIRPTKDGLRYVYKHKPCSIYSDTLNDDLADIVTQARSY